jgi:SMC interacting uncharacterized protein involved in chromosome segregation
MVKCEICGVGLKTTQALAGHKQFKHKLAEKYAQAYQLAGSVELLERKIAELEGEKIKTEAYVAQIKQDVQEIESQKAKKQAELMQLQELGQIKASEVARVFRQQLIQAGWYPVHEMDAGSLVLLALLRWYSTNNM